MNRVYVSRTDVLEPLASFSRHPFELEELEWPSVEHYYQAMKFEDPELREAIRASAHPKDAQKMARKNKRRVRSDWNKVKETIMTRGIYIQCRTHPEVSNALLRTGEKVLVENSQYDYYWGCGRDGRGRNAYGRILMEVRERLRNEAAGLYP